MDKYQAFEIISKSNISTYDVAHSIYLATVQGVSGANQNDGYGFALSAIAELWNIRGTLNNPNGRTKITNRYRGMGITEDMILTVINQYPNGFEDYMPTFDSVLGVGSVGRAQNDTVRREQSNNIVRRRETSNNAGNNISNIDLIVAIVAFIVFKFFIGWGWIVSFIVAMIVGAVVDVLRRKFFR